MQQRYSVSLTLYRIRYAGNSVRNQMVASMACISHLSFSAALKFLFKYVYKNGGSPADLLIDQAVLNPKGHGHTSRAQQVGIEPTTPQSQAVALPTTPQIPIQ